MVSVLRASKESVICKEIGRRLHQCKCLEDGLLPVICNGIIYAIGGQTDPEPNIKTNTFKKYAFVEDK